MLAGHNFFLFVFLFFLISIADKFLVEAIPSFKQKIHFRIIYTYTIIYSWVVVSSWSLSFFHQLKPNSIKVYSCTVLLFSMFLVKDKRIHSGSLFVDAFKKFRLQPRLIQMIVLTILCWCIIAFLRIYIMQPNNYDSLTTHCFNPSIWLQNGFIGDFNSFGPLNFTYPLNPYLMTIFTLAFSGNNRFIELPQLFAWIVVAVCLFSTLTEYKVSKKIALVISGIFTTSPIVLAISTTNQTDLPLLSSFAMVLFFLTRYFNKRLFVDLVFLSASLGLLLGSKHHGIIVLFFALAVLAIWFVSARDKMSFKSISQVVPIVLMSLLALGSIKYLQNYYYTSSFLRVELSGMESGLAFSKLWFNLKTVWPDIFFDTPLSIAGWGVWQHNTSCYGLLISFVIFPGIFVGIFNVSWRSINAVFKTPLPLFVIGVGFLMVFGLASYNVREGITNYFIHDTRKIIIFVYSAVVFGGWGLSIFFLSKTKSPIYIYGISSILIFQISGWLCGHSIRRIVVCILSVLMLFIIKRIASSPKLLTITTNFLIVVFFVALPFRYVMTNIYESHSNILIMKKSIYSSRIGGPSFLLGNENTNIYKNYSKIRELVPLDASLFFENTGYESGLYVYVGEKHTRKVRLLSNWNASDKVDSSISYLLKELESKNEVWVALEKKSEIEKALRTNNYIRIDFFEPLFDQSLLKLSRSSVAFI